MEWSWTIDVLARQRADTLAAIAHTAEWSASVAMVLQLMRDPSVQQDFLGGKIISGTNTGEVLVALSALGDLFNPSWSSGVVKRQVRAGARGYHISRLLVGSSEELRIPSGYEAQITQTYS